MGKKAKRPTWFKLWLNQKPLIDAVPDESVGKAIKAAYQYFDTGEVLDLDPLSGAVFAVLKSQVDKAIEDYKDSVEFGKAGALERWGNSTEENDTPPIDPLPKPIDPLPKPIGYHAEDRREKIEERRDNIYSPVIQLLNELSGSNFRASTKGTQKLINARVREGYGLDDFEAVIRHQCDRWRNNKEMRPYLRPDTLFGNKFESYLCDARRNTPKKDSGYVLAPLEDPWEVAMREKDYV